MRAVILVLVILIVGAIAAFATGFVSIGNIRGSAPQIATTNNGIVAKGGQAPAFDVETGSVKVGTGEANVTVPKVTIERDQKKVSVPKLEIQPAQPQSNKTAQ
jgi:hypothetical protein